MLGKKNAQGIYICVCVCVCYSLYGIQLICHCDIVTCKVLSSKECPYIFRFRSIAIVVAVLLNENNSRHMKWEHKCCSKP